MLNWLSSWLLRSKSYKILEKIILGVFLTNTRFVVDPLNERK